MGARYDVDGICPHCGKEFSAWYAPTSGFLYHTHDCGFEIDLESYTGINAESTASTQYGIEAIQKFRKS